MIPEDKVEEKFEKLIDYLKWSAKIVRKIFTPDAFNYPFLLPLYDKHKLFKERIIDYFPSTQISYTDIRKGKFVFPDGIYPIVEISQKLDLPNYIKKRDKNKLNESITLSVISGPEQPQKIRIFDDGTDKSFIKNLEKIFGEKISLLRSDFILFLVAKNGILELRYFSLSNDNDDNTDFGNDDEFKVKYDRINFGMSFLASGKLFPFGETPITWEYNLSKLFFGLIIDFLWNNQEDDKDKMLRGLKSLAKTLWTDGMFAARTEFLYFNSIDLEEGNELFMNATQKKERLEEYEKMRANPDLYPPTLPADTEWVKYDDFIDGNVNLRYIIYLITQYYDNAIVLKDPDGGTIVIYDIPSFFYDKLRIITDENLYAHFFGKDKTKWKVGFMWNWPISGSKDLPFSWADYYLTFFYIYLPFNPYVKSNASFYIRPYIKSNGALYIPNESGIDKLLFKNVIRRKPEIIQWMKKRVEADKEELHKRLEDLLNELSAGNLREDTIYKFDMAGEEDRDKRKRMNIWKKEWEKLPKETKQEEISEISKIREEEKQQEEVFETKKEEEKEQKFIEELKQEVEIHEEEEQKQLQTVEPKTDDEIIDDEIIDDEIMDEIMEKVIEKIKEYLNSEEYKQELISALQKLLEENPEYRKINEFMKEYYPENVPVRLSGIPKRIYRWRNKYWDYDTETKESQLQGVYLVIYKWFEPKGRHDEIYWAYIASRKGLDKNGNEKFYVKLIGDVRYMRYVGNRLVYAVLYKGKEIDFITTELPNELYAYLYCGTTSRVCLWMPEMVLKVIWPIFQKMVEKINFQKMVEKIKREVLSSVKEEEKQEVKIDKEQEKTTEKPKRKKEEKQETQIEKEQMETTEKPKRRKKEEEISEVQQKEQKDTTEKPKRKKKEEKISEPQQEQEEKGKEEKVEATTESKKATEEIEQGTKETKEQDIIEELESADVEVEAKVKSKVQITLPKEMIEDLEELKKKTTKRKKKNKRKKTR